VEIRKGDDEIPLLLLSLC